MRFTYTSFFLLLAFIATGQMLQSPMRFTNFSIADGLPTNNVNHVMQDSRGFVWLSTTQGLACYDGNRFIVYKHSRADSNSMPFDDVRDCIELGNHELIFRCGSSMWMLEPVSGRQHPPPSYWNSETDVWPRKISNHLIAIKVEGTIYFTDFNLTLLDSVQSPAAKDYFEVFYLGNNKVLFRDYQRIFCYSLHSKKMEEWKFEKAPLKYSHEIFVKDADTINKKIYIAGYNDGVFTLSYDEASPDYLKETKDPVTQTSANSDILISNSCIIAPFLNGLTIQQAGKPEIILKNIPGDNTSIMPGDLREVFAGSNGQYWVTGNNGVSHFTLNQINYQYCKLPYSATISHYSKYGNTFWMSSETKGSIAFNTITNQLQIIDSTIIQYCWGAVPVNNQVYLYGNSTTGKYANDKNNVKLLAYNPKDNTISTPSFITPFYHGAELITLIYQSSNGDTWYSINYGNGLVRQKAGTNECVQYRRKDNPSPFNFGYLNKAAEDKNGNIYFSVNKDNKILVWKNKQQQFETWKMDSLMGRTDVHFGPLQNHIIDSKQNLWITYEAVGLVQYNLETKKGRLYEQEDGLPYNIIDNMVADAQDNIWIPTPKGLCCLLAATNKFITFTQKDGLPFNDFQHCYLFFDNADSSIYYNKEDYLYKINTDALLKRRITAEAALVLEGMMVNNQPYFFTAGNILQLQPDENNLQFSFILIDIENRIKERAYEYLLLNEGKKQQWEKLTGNNISFYHLNPGQYTLQIRMLNPATGNYVYSNIFRFSIATTWYKTVWFTLLAAAVLLGIIFFIVRGYYLRKLLQQKALLEKEKALEAERQRIAADMHDDIGAGLSRIRYITASMKESSYVNKEDMDRILSLSDESVEKMNEIIWSLNQGNQQLEELIYYTRSQCSEMANLAGIRFTFDLPENIPAITLGWKECRNIYLLVKEAVNNAIKHSGADSITIECIITGQLQFSISDNGKGFNPDAVKKTGNGLLNYIKRIDNLKGTYHLITSRGQGTKLVFSFPLSTNP